MHRQSLGSPASKLHLQILKDESLASESQNLITEEKSQHKTLKLNPKSPEKYIHFIPILTLFCFLILYLTSHNPSPNDLAQFKHFPKSTGSEDEIETILKIKNGDILAIRSLKNLEENGNRKNRLHRKIADF
ncbi:Hypothetical predicted protein [Olea europaea subsp. europaea]|uniref:Uncharacterized protein n=1 Tax=Olea europaea subsp. europaea TaxID=158383 RepID=A0A8S0TWM4_OLEEU|nr:Hypothetical predicted protein [Olea europaea subsp. europaea]